jgi:hypothetical protein
MEEVDLIHMEELGLKFSTLRSSVNITLEEESALRESSICER